MDDQDFGSIKLLNLKYWTTDQIIQTFCKISSFEKFHSLIGRNFKTLRKALLGHEECIKIYWMTKNYGPLNL